jgi:hypothetical protein
MFKKISININILQALKKFLLKICKEIDNHKNKRKITNDPIYIHFEDQNAYINGSQFINQKSEQQIAILRMLLDTQYNSRLNGIEDIGCTWMKLASEIDLQKQNSRKKRKSKNIITSEQHIRQLISQIRKKAKEATKDENFNLINEAVKGRYILNEKTALF